MIRLYFILLMLPGITASAQKSYSSKEPITTPKIFGEGIISTGNFETHPAFSPGGDTLYFLKMLADGNFCIICVSYFRNGKWTPPEVASFSGQYTDADPFVTRDGNTIYFVSNRPHQKGEPVRDDWDIWKTERSGSIWKEPVPLDSPINSSSSEFFPTLADNGNLYFGSDREDGKGRADIYVAKFVNGHYEAPENLGDLINTSANEYEPYISPDESFLIFMGTPNSIQNTDFYISFHKNGHWTQAKKIPEPINSSATEWGGKMTRDGKYFFFGSSRNKIYDHLPQRENMQQYEKRLNSAGNGLGDIYQIDAAELFRLVEDSP
jgi:Tol biopolymer transport system component